MVQWQVELGIGHGKMRTLPCDKPIFSINYDQGYLLRDKVKEMNREEPDQYSHPGEQKSKLIREM